MYLNPNYLLETCVCFFFRQTHFFNSLFDLVCILNMKLHTRITFLIFYYLLQLLQSARNVCKSPHQVFHGITKFNRHLLNLRLSIKYPSFLKILFPFTTLIRIEEQRISCEIHRALLDRYAVSNKQTQQDSYR